MTRPSPKSTPSQEHQTTIAQHQSRKLPISKLTMPSQSSNSNGGYTVTSSGTNSQVCGCIAIPLLHITHTQPLQSHFPIPIPIPQSHPNFVNPTPETSHILTSSQTGQQLRQPRLRLVRQQLQLVPLLQLQRQLLLLQPQWYERTSPLIGSAGIARTILPQFSRLSSPSFEPPAIPSRKPARADLPFFPPQVPPTTIAAPATATTPPLRPPPAATEESD